MPIITRECVVEIKAEDVICAARELTTPDEKAFYRDLFIEFERQYSPLESDLKGVLDKPRFSDEIHDLFVKCGHAVGMVFPDEA